jgi:hypothetical protein
MHIIPRKELLQYNIVSYSDEPMISFITAARLYEVGALRLQNNVRACR